MPHTQTTSQDRAYVGFELAKASSTVREDEQRNQFKVVSPNVSRRSEISISTSIYLQEWKVEPHSLACASFGFGSVEVSPKRERHLQACCRS
jgi:hypothetical protein